VILLGTDTALGACSAAVLDGERVLAHEHLPMQRGHAEALAPMVERVMREAGITFPQLDRVAVTTGPGTFTGQRVGLAFARALGVALAKPVIGITTLDAMAEQALAQLHLRLAIAVADAKRGEVYFGVRSAKRETLIAPELIAIEAVVGRMEALAFSKGHAIAIAGTASEATKPLLEATGWKIADSGVRQPDAIFVAKLAVDAPLGQAPKPLYLREPDAKLPGSTS
jgi:tRNA threonylcarbamoyl adenosine modification protein YeaZ